MSSHAPFVQPNIDAIDDAVPSPGLNSSDGLIVFAGLLHSVDECSAACVAWPAQQVRQVFWGDDVWCLMLLTEALVGRLCWNASHSRLRAVGRGVGANLLPATGLWLHYYSCSGDTYCNLGSTDRLASLASSAYASVNVDLVGGAATIEWRRLSWFSKSRLTHDKVYMWAFERVSTGSTGAGTCSSSSSASLSAVNRSLGGGASRDSQGARTLMNKGSRKGRGVPFFSQSLQVTYALSSTD